MANLGETTKVSRMVLVFGNKEYELDGGGSQVGPDTVDSAAIIDGSVNTEDLSDEVKDKMTNTYDSSNEKLTLGSLNVVKASTAPTEPTQQMVVEEEEEP